jgi:hypothetical protein
MGKRGRNDSSHKNDELVDWITALAKKNEVSSAEFAESKQERIERRQAKKLRREERTKTLKTYTSIRDSAPVIAGPSEPTKLNLANHHHVDESKNIAKTRGLLTMLSQQIEDRVSEIHKTKKSKRPFHASFIKAKKRKRTHDEHDMIRMTQPRKNDYGGIGMARPSLYIELDDPSWKPKLEEEFKEHIPGFFGKQRAKVMKKQLDGKLLWRQLRQPSIINTLLKDRKIGGKKLSSMTPDERVEAMIKAGML